jgi:hypothetical protein
LNTEIAFHQIINSKIVYVQREIAGIVVLAWRCVASLCLYQQSEQRMHGFLLGWGGLLELVVDKMIPCQLETNAAACPMLASI